MLDDLVEGIKVVKGIAGEMNQVTNINTNMKVDVLTFIY